MEDWDDSDSAALRAALCGVEAWDCDLSTLFELDSESSSSDVSCPRKQRSSTVSATYKPHKDSRRLKIAALRVQVEGLQHALALEEALVGLNAGNAEAMEAVALRSEWERIANSQLTQRSAAEQENALLRNLMLTQKKTAQQIVRLIKRVDLLEASLPWPPASSFEHYAGPKVSLQRQLTRLDEMALRAADVFSTGKFSDDSCFRGVFFEDSTPAVDGVDVHFHAAWSLPFTVEQVADALWMQTMRTTFKDKNVVYMDIYEDASSMVSQFISTASAKDRGGSSEGQVAARRLPQTTGDDAVLIVTQIQARSYSGSKKWQGSAHVEGWLRISSVSSEDEGKRLSGPVTRVKWYRRTLMTPPEDAEMTPSERCKWTNSLIAGQAKARFQKDLDWSMQAIENMLVTPAVARQ